MKHFILIFLLASSAASSQRLDTEFADQGISIPYHSTYAADARSVVIQPDGKILVGGSDNGSIVILRYLPDGTLDYSFGVGGMVVTTYTNSAGYRNPAGLYQLSLLPNGKILASGAVSVIPAELYIRYHNDGRIDSSFGNNGSLVIEDFFIAFSAIFPNGEIIISGENRYPHLPDQYYYRTNMMKVDSNGFVDSTFVFYRDFIIGHITNIVPTSDTSFLEFHRAGNKILVQQYTTFGKQIPVGNKWMDTLEFAAFDLTPWSVIAHKDDVYLTGFFRKTENSKDDIFLMKLSRDGLFDRSFGLAGIATLSTDYYEAATSIAVEETGKILIGGYGSNSTQKNQFLLVRFDKNGSIDSSFGSSGIYVSYLGPYGSGINAMQLQSDGKLVAAGRVFKKDYYDLIVARYIPYSQAYVNIFNNHENVLLNPNPLATYASFHYELASTCKITLKLIDVLGRPITTFLEDEYRSKGTHSEQLLIPNELEPGNYYLAIEFGNMRKVVLVNKQ